MAEKKKAEQVKTEQTKKVKATSAKKSATVNQKLKDALYVLIIFAVIAGIVLFANFVLDPISLYRSAGKYADEGNYDKAMEIYSELDGFLGSEKKIDEINVMKLEQGIEDENYEAAVIAAESIDLQKYIAEKPEIFFNYAKQQAQNNPSVAKVYIDYVPDYPGAVQLHDEICLRNAWKLMEMDRYADVLKNFDEASSYAWLESLSPSEVYDYAIDMAEYSYVRAAKILELVQDVNPAAAEKRAALEEYLVYCGEKTCVSDTYSGESVNTVNVFDFFIKDDTEYLIANDGDISAVYDANNYAFAKDTDGSYFSMADDPQTATSYLYRFYMLENGSLQEKLTTKLPDGTKEEYIRLWD